jgi:hypothetical protein
MQLNEFEKGSSIKIESLCNVNSDQEKRYFEKLEELNKCQKELQDLEVKNQLKNEKMQTDANN